MKKLWKHTDLIVTLLLAGMAVVALVSPYVDPANNWLYAFFALIFPWLYGVNFLLFIYWFLRLVVKRKNRWLSIFFPLVILVWGWFSPARVYRYNFFAQAAPNQPTVRVMSYNTHGLSGMRGQKNKLEKDFQQFLATNNPDILLCQETSRTVAKYLADSLHYFHTVNNSKLSIGSAIISRYPIVKYDMQRFYKSGNSYTWADIKIKNDTIRFFSLHLQSNAISKETKKLSQDTDLKKRKTWSRIRRIFALYRMTAKQRTAQAAEVKALAQKSPYPVVFAGDFNDPALSNTYHILAENRIDSFTERGKGTGMTYPGMSLNLRIDYILVPNGFKVLNHQVLHVSFSDHYPIMADITWF